MLSTNNRLLSKFYKKDIKKGQQFPLEFQAGPNKLPQSSQRGVAINFLCELCGRYSLNNSPYALDGQCKPAALRPERTSLVGHSYNYDLLASALLVLSDRSSLWLAFGPQVRKMSKQSNGVLKDV